MNANLVKLLQQFQEVWKQLGANQRVSVALATLVFLAGIVGVTVWSSRTDYGLLYGKLSDSEASKVIAALDDAKIPYKIGSGGSSILVPAEKVHMVRMQLAGKGIPRGDGVGFEIFDKPNFGISDFVQRANYIRALQGELARTIQQIDEIDSARVMVVLPENRLLIDKDKHPTASVFIRLRGNGQLQPQAVNSIRFLVANAVEGLKPNFVSVVDNQGNVLSENTENDSLFGLTASQLDARRNQELYLAKKAEGMLEKVLGPGQAIVRVSAEINFDTTERTEDKYDPDGQVPKQVTKDDSNEDSITANNNEAAGVTANTPGATSTNAPGGPMTTTKNKKTTATTEYDNSKTRTTVTQVAGGIKRLSAAVTVAQQVKMTGTTRELVKRDPAELKKIEGIARAVLGIDATRGDEISVEEMPFNDQFATEVTRNLETQEKRDLWWSVGKNVAYPALALGILFLFVRTFKRTSSEEIPLGVPVGRMGAHLGNGNGHGNGHQFELGNGENGNDVVTVEVLNQLIKENPQNMTQAIRSWLNRGTPSNQ